MEIISEKVIVKSTRPEIISFLVNAQNLIELLPQDKIKDFTADESQCSFKVQGGITISLVENGTEGEEKIFLKSGEKTPFPFNMTIHLNEVSEGVEGFIEFQGEVNAFLKMMVENPMRSLFNYMSKKLQEKFN